MKLPIAHARRVPLRPCRFRTVVLYGMDRLLQLSSHYPCWGPAGAVRNAHKTRPFVAIM